MWSQTTGARTAGPEVPGGPVASHRRRVVLHCAAIVAVSAAAAASYGAGWDSPVRVALTLGFMLFVPGLALTELLGVHEPFQRLAIAPAASLALETLVALALLYARAYSPGLALAIVVGVTLCAVTAAVLRTVVRRA